MARVIPHDTAHAGDMGGARVESLPTALPARRAWPSPAVWVALILVFVLSAYWQTTLSMASIWQRAETYAHGFVVVPIFLYLVWRQRDVLAGMAVRPCYPALLGIAVAGLIWLAGESVSAVSVSQFAMVAMIPLAVWGVLGTRIAMKLGIPLGFLFFAVPFGDFLYPTLMDWTADFTVWALRATGVPVYREGNFFTIPSGHWSVIEACSGVRYLIASFMVGSLYAYLTYRSTARRLAFIAASLLVPIVANWLRAYMIVMLGHLTNNTLAVGADHLIYGWIFFGLVMALLFWVASHWRQDEEPLVDSGSGSSARSTAGEAAHAPWVAVAAALVLIAVWLPAEAWLGRNSSTGMPHLNQIAGHDGWNVTAGELSAWKPDVSHARIELRESFMKNGTGVGLHLAYFRNQTSEEKAITSNNQIVSTLNPRWRRVHLGMNSMVVGGEPFDVRTATVSDERESLLIWQWFWVDGHVTSSEYAAKFFQVLSVFRGHGDPVAWVIIYTPLGQSEAQASAALQAFTADMRSPIDAGLRQAAAE